MSSIQIEKILSIFPEKRIRDDLRLFEDKDGSLYIRTDNKLLKILLEGIEGVNIREVEKEEEENLDLNRVTRLDRPDQRGD